MVCDGIGSMAQAVERETSERGLYYYIIVSSGRESLEQVRNRVNSRTGQQVNCPGGRPQRYDHLLSARRSWCATWTDHSVRRCAVTMRHFSAGANPPGNCRVWTPPKLQAFSESPLYLRTRRSRVRWIGSPRQRSGSRSLPLVPVERGPAFWLARKGFPHGRPRQSPARAGAERRTREAG